MYETVKLERFKGKVKISSSFSLTLALSVSVKLWECEVQSMCDAVSMLCGLTAVVVQLHPSLCISSHFPKVLADRWI